MGWTVTKNDKVLVVQSEKERGWLVFIDNKRQKLVVRFYKTLKSLILTFLGFLVSFRFGDYCED